MHPYGVVQMPFVETNSSVESVKSRQAMENRRIIYHSHVLQYLTMPLRDTPRERVTFRSHTHAHTQRRRLNEDRGSIPSTSTPTGIGDGNPTLSRSGQDTETKDGPPPKQTYPFEGSALEKSSLFLTSCSGATRWPLVLTVIMWILESREKE